MSLAIDGYVVVPAPPGSESLRVEILQEVRNLPEFSVSTTPQDISLGGFCALGLPSTFHLPSVRKARQLAHPYVRDILKQDGFLFEQLPDRLLVRPPGRKVAYESWHRDESKFALESDQIFGGWWNFDSCDQYFSCVPGTHTEVRGHGGFAKIGDTSNYEKNKKKIVIPAGHIIIFYEHIVHEVLPSTAKDTLVRLFLGWRLTHSRESLTDTRILRDQGVVQIKSGQIPQIYSSYHLTKRNLPILLRFAEKFREECKEKKTIREVTYNIPHQKMRSLREYGLPLYPDYTEDELRMFLPS